MASFKKVEIDELTDSGQDDESQLEKSLFDEAEVIRNPLAICNMPLCDDADLDCVIQMVDAIICEAVVIIKSDPRNLFCYKYPKSLEIPEHDESCTVDVVVADYPNGRSIDPVNEYNHAKSNTSTSIRLWMKISEFEYSNIISDIRDYISKWELSPNTKCVVLSNFRRHEVPIKGSIYFADAHFSRPTPRCPNPLAVAKVRFIITVSKVLLTHYPVMITYRFEGFKTLYYAIGDRETNSPRFQRFYIDSILHTKLHFFAEICECRHGTVENPKKNIRTTKPRIRKSLI